MNVIEVFNDSYERCVLSEHFFERFMPSFGRKERTFGRNLKA